MKIAITGKGDVASLLAQKKFDFGTYELYLHSIDDLSQRKVSRLQQMTTIASVHQPSNVIIRDRVFEFNLLGPKKVREKSRKDLVKTLHLCKQLTIDTVVLHGITYDHQTMARDDAVKDIVDFIGELDHKHLLTLETDLYWNNVFTMSHKPLMVLPEVFEQVVSVTSTCITLDIEHVMISGFYLTFVKEYPKHQFAADFAILFNHWIRHDTEKKVKKVYGHLIDFVSQFKKVINHIHLNGSDWFNYYLLDSLPFVGEHLPVGFDDPCLFVKDQFDYQKIYKIIGLLDKDLNIVLEVGLREEHYEYFQAMKQSKKYLIKKGW